jgi:hypothetical protein
LPGCWGPGASLCQGVGAQVLVFDSVFLEERGLQRGGEGLDEGGACDDAGGGDHVFHPRVLLLRQEPENRRHRLQSVL